MAIKKNHKYLFILAIVRTGSTILQQLIATSKNVSTFIINGKFVEGQFLPTMQSIYRKNGIDPYKDYLNISYDWQLIKTKWHKHWNTNKSILLEKTPLHVLYANDIETHFDAAYFIVLVRDPYALYHREIKNIKELDTIIQRQEILRRAIYYIWLFKCQKRNMETLKNVLLITYEELIHNINGVKEKLIKFLPELMDINSSFAPQKKATILNKYIEKITDLNAHQISALNQEYLDTINYVYEKNVDILSYFNYQIRKELIATNLNIYE